MITTTSHFLPINPVKSFEIFLRLVLMFFILLVHDNVLAQPVSYYGHFVGQLLLVPDADGVRMRLIAPYEFVDAAGGAWMAPAGTFSDGASIPQVAKSFIGGSWDGRYRNAAVIHDVACALKNRPWEAVHLMFYHAMLASGVPSRTAKIMYAAVYHFGPRWEPNGRTYLPMPEPRAIEAAKVARDLTSHNQVQNNCAGNSGGFFGSMMPCNPNLTNSFSVERQILPMQPSAELSIETIQQASSLEFSRMTAIIDEQEKSGQGLSVEEIQRLR